VTLLLGWTQSIIPNVQAFSPPPLLLKTLGEFLKAGKLERQSQIPSPPQPPLSQPPNNIAYYPTTSTTTTTTTITTPAYDPLNPPLKVIRPGDILWTPGYLGNDFDFFPFYATEMCGSCTFDRKTSIWKGTVVDGTDDKSTSSNNNGLIGVRSVLEGGNGGLIGIRSLPNVQYDVSHCRGLLVTVKLLSSPDNMPKEIKFKTRNTYDAMDGTTFTTPLDTAWPGEDTCCTTWNIDFDRQIPTQFARVVHRHEAFNKTTLTGLKFVYSKLRYENEMTPYFALGTIEMELVGIQAY
jgi:hypothetical protein